MLVSGYSKSILAVIAAGIGILVAALSDDVINATEIVNVVIGIATAVGVYVIPNASVGAAKYLKTIVALVGAGLTALATALGGTLGFENLTTSDWLSVTLAALTAVGVFIVPNTDTAPLVGDEGPLAVDDLD